MQTPRTTRFAFRVLARTVFALGLFSAGIALAILGTTDVNLITGTETHPNVTQQDSVAWGHGDTVVVVYRDGRETVTNICGISVSTNGGETFTRITPSPFTGECYGNPSIFYSVRAGKWFFSANGGGCGLGQWESSDAINWVSSGCIVASGSPGNHSTWVDNNPGSPNYGRQYAAFNGAFGTGPINSTYSMNDGVTWVPTSTVNSTFQRVVKMTGSLGTDGTVFIQSLYDGVQGGLIGRRRLYLYRSAEGGAWEEIIQGPTIVDSQYSGPGRVDCSDNPNAGCIYSTGYWWDQGWGQPGVGPNRIFHYVFSAWPDEGTDPGNIYYIRATYTLNGMNWSLRVKLNTDSTTRAQWGPSLAVNAQGMVVVSWYDERNTIDNSLERYARVSLDNGLTWGPDMPISDGPFPLPTQPDPGFGSTSVGKYNHAMFSDDGYGGDAYLTWVDGRVSINGSPQQNIFFDKIPLIPPGLYMVTTIADHDDGTCNASDCTLREAINAANTHPGKDFIQFSPGVAGTIQLASALPNLSSNLELQGPGAKDVAVRRNTGGDYRIFTVSNGTTGGPTVTISGLTMTNGAVSGQVFPDNAGGGVYNHYGKLTLLNCALIANSGGFSGGGGIFSNGNGSGSASLTLKGCTLSGNFASGSFGGAIHNTAAGTGSAILRIENCTFSANGFNGTSGGGGIFNYGAGTSGNAAVTVLNSTFAGNDATSGGAIFNDKESTATASLIIGNTILKAGLALNFANDGTITSQGHNISSDHANGSGGTTGPGGYLNGPGDKRNTEPLLAAGLANNGGPTQTYALLPGSPAINGGDDGIATKLDQRGYLRLGISDVGAFEFGGGPLRITSIARPANGHAILQGVGVPNGAHTVHTSPDLTSGFSNPTTVTADAFGAIVHDDVGAVGLTKRFYRLSFP